MQVKIEVNAEAMERILSTIEWLDSWDVNVTYENTGVDAARIREALNCAVIKETERRDNRALMLGVKI